MNILIMAIKIWLRRGETLEQALSHYQLTDDQKAEARKALEK